MDSVDEKRWTLEYPELGTGPVPLAPYVDPAQFELERQHVFRAVWLNVGRIEEVPRAGDYIVKEIEILNTSVIIVRRKDGGLSAFHNMCSHRGNRVAIERCGSARDFTCNFHGWVYGNDGRLLSVPDEDNFFGLCKEDLGLTPLALDTWEGFVFVNVNQQPSQSLQEFLGDYATSFAGFPFHEAPVCYSWSVEVNVNWKIAKDAFIEGYHVTSLHRRSVAQLLATPSNQFAHSLSFNTYGPHQSTSAPGNFAAPQTAVGLSARKYGAGIKRLRMADSLEEFNDLPPGVNPTRSADWMFDVTTVFPNMNIHYFRNNFTTYNFWPIAVDRTRWEVKQYYPSYQDAGNLFAHEVGKVLFRDTVLEDLGTLERTQSVLKSGAKDRFFLNDQEVLIRRFNKIIDDYVGAEGRLAAV